MDERTIFSKMLISISLFSLIYIEELSMPFLHSSSQLARLGSDWLFNKLVESGYKRIRLAEINVSGVLYFHAVQLFSWFARWIAGRLIETVLSRADTLIILIERDCRCRRGRMDR